VKVTKGMAIFFIIRRVVYTRMLGLPNLLNLEFIKKVLFVLLVLGGTCQ